MFLFSLSLSKIQEETLRTYIFTFGAVYDSLRYVTWWSHVSHMTHSLNSSSLHRLSEMFELPLASVHSIISRMIIKEELLVSHVTCLWSSPDRHVTRHHWTNPHSAWSCITRNQLNCRACLYNSLRKYMLFRASSLSLSPSPLSPSLPLFFLQRNYSFFSLSLSFFPDWYGCWSSWRAPQGEARPWMEWVIDHMTNRHMIACYHSDRGWRPHVSVHQDRIWKYVMSLIMWWSCDCLLAQ